MNKIKTVVAYLTGYAQTKKTFYEIRRSLNLPINFLRGLWGGIIDIRRETEEAKALASQDDKALWDEMCRNYKITTKSVQFKYKIALFTNLILVLGVGLVVGNFLSNIEAGIMMVFANIIFLNIVLIMLFQNAYRLNMAYTQSAPPAAKFFKSILKEPILLIGRTLPADYKVRLETYNE